MALTRDIIRPLSPSISILPTFEICILDNVEMTDIPEVIGTAYRHRLANLIVMLA